MEWYNVWWPCLTSKRVARFVSGSWVSCYTMGRLTSNKPFDFSADLNHDPDPWIFKRNFFSLRDKPTKAPFIAQQRNSTQLDVASADASADA